MQKREKLFSLNLSRTSIDSTSFSKKSCAPVNTARGRQKCSTSHARLEWAGMFLNTRVLSNLICSNLLYSILPSAMVILNSHKNITSYNALLALRPSSSSSSLLSFASYRFSFPAYVFLAFFPGRLALAASLSLSQTCFGVRRANVIALQSCTWASARLKERPFSSIC